MDSARDAVNSDIGGRAGGGMCWRYLETQRGEESGMLVRLEASVARIRRRGRQILNQVHWDGSKLVQFRRGRAGCQEDFFFFPHHPSGWRSWSEHVFSGTCSQNIIIIRGEPTRISATLSLFVHDVGRPGVRSHPITRDDQTAARLLMKCDLDDDDDGRRVTFTYLQCFPPHQNYSELGWTDSGQSSTANKGHLEFDLVIRPSFCPRFEPQSPPRDPPPPLFLPLPTLRRVETPGLHPSPESYQYSWVCRVRLHDGCLISLWSPCAKPVGAPTSQQQSGVWSAERTAARIDLHTLSSPSTQASIHTQMLPTGAWIHASST